MGGDEVRELRVEPREAGQRLDHFLAARLGISHGAARRLLAAGAVRRNGRPVALAQKGEEVAAGMLVAVPGGGAQAGEGAALAPAPRVIAQPDLSLRILAEGLGWIAVDKPAGMAVHPLRAGETGTVLNAIIARHPEMHNIGEGGLRSGVVHRLDVDTSGALLCATTEEAWRRLRDLFARHRIGKAYRAIVLGSLTEGGTVELLLRVARSRPARVAVVEPSDARRLPPGTRRCGMSWRPLEPLEGATLVEARPVSGFLHQVRVTFAHLGHPLAGDRAYGPPEDRTRAGRHMLHAARLAWREGSTERRVESPDAPDFAALLASLRRGADSAAGS